MVNVGTVLGRIVIGALIGGGVGLMLGLLPTVGSYYLLDVPNNPGPHGTGMGVMLVGMVCLGGGGAVGCFVGGLIGGLSCLGGPREH